jgi:hypothetical protein
MISTKGRLLPRLPRTTDGSSSQQMCRPNPTWPNQTKPHAATSVTRRSYLVNKIAAVSSFKFVSSFSCVQKTKPWHRYIFKFTVSGLLLTVLLFFIIHDLVSSKKISLRVDIHIDEYRRQAMFAAMPPGRYN